MRLIGTVKSFDVRKGFGSILPESGGEALRFDSSAVKWGRTSSPAAQQRLTYELGAGADGEPRALNLQSITRNFL